VLEPEPAVRDVAPIVQPPIVPDVAVIEPTTLKVEPSQSILFPAELPMLRRGVPLLYSNQKPVPLS
jgi:hypothetical protein